MIVIKNVNNPNLQILQMKMSLYSNMNVKIIVVKQLVKVYIYIIMEMKEYVY